MVQTTTIINIKELFQSNEKDNRQPVKVLKIGMLYTLLLVFSKQLYSRSNYNRLIAFFSIPEVRVL